MSNYYSILRFVSNPLSGESIALGLIMLTPNEAFFQVSPTKVDFAKKLNPAGGKLLDFALDQLHRFLNYDLVDQSGQAIRFPVQLNKGFLDRLADYNNGLLQFSKPAYLESDRIATDFNTYFAQFIEAALPPSTRQEKPEATPLSTRVEVDLYQPLRGVIDVDYTLHRKQLPTLYFDYHLDGIGINGALYTVKAIDLNSNQNTTTLEKELTEYECVIGRLEQFARERGIAGRPYYYLVTDSYEGSNKIRRALYEDIQSQKLPACTVITSADLASVSAKIKAKNVRKFSDELTA